MDHEDHVRLLEKGIPGSGGTWADFGSGKGAFTAALAELIGPEGRIYSIDQDAPALESQARSFKEKYPAGQPEIRYLNSDFRLPLELPTLDGGVIANALHFHADQVAVLQLLRTYLSPGGCLILVEYNAERGNTWVPYPISSAAWDSLALQAGFGQTRLLTRVPSSFMGEIYSAIGYKIDNLER